MFKRGERDLHRLPRIMVTVTRDPAAAALAPEGEAVALRVELAGFTRGAAGVEEVTVLGDGEEDEAVDGAQQFLEQSLHGERASGDLVAQVGIGGDDALPQFLQRGGDVGVEILAGLDPLLEPGLAPLFQRAIGRCGTFRAEAGGVGEEPESGEVREHLVTEHRAEIGLDPCRAGEAGIVAHDPHAVAREDETPQGVIGAVKPVLQECGRRAAGAAAFPIAEFGLGFGEGIAGVYRSSDDDGHAPAFAFPGDAIAAGALLVFDRALKVGEAKALGQQVAGKGGGAGDGLGVCLIIVAPDRLTDAEEARDLVAEAGAFGAAVAVGGLGGTIGGDDLLHLFRRDQPALDGERDKAEFGGGRTARHQLASGTRT
ncbi:hypothetical protein [Novosphingobium sp. THN1]|uniref:hypothetical protein n=1 Tax=Novosphingobium sp. THN1 TaxID=1016987 RepID=UPI001F078C69|nr:hypothetical protein [Novosphingobium sp. THN1]